MLNKKTMIRWICFILAFFLLLAQLFYYGFLKVKGYEYVWDFMPHLLNICFVVCIGIALYQLKDTRKYHQLIAGITIAFLLLMFVLLCTLGMKRDCIVSFGNINHPMVIKVDKESKQPTIYQKTFFLFATNPQPLNDTLDAYQIKWLNEDISVLIYESKKDPHMYVIANDSRNSIRYSHPASELQGTWKADKTTLEATNKTYTIDGKTFALQDIEEVGINAVIVNDSNGKGHYIIGYDPSLRFIEGGAIKTGSTISVMDVQDAKLPITTYKKSSTDFSYVEEPLTNDEKGKKTVKEMKQIIKEYPRIADYPDEYYYVKVINQTSDIRMIALDALKAFDMQGSSDCTSEVTINHVTKTHGDEQDFFIEVATTSTASCGVESETLDITWYLRVMKTTDGYLVAKTLHYDNGFYGLKELKNPEALPCEPEIFHYIN